MIFCILQIVLLQFQTHLLLIRSFPFDFFTKTLKGIIVLSKQLLVVRLIKEFLLVLLFQSFYLKFLITGNLTYQHLIIGPATVFQQYSKNFPNVCYQGILLVCMLKTFFYEFIETNRINEKCAVNSINQLGRDST